MVDQQVVPAAAPPAPSAVDAPVPTPVVTPPEVAQTAPDAVAPVAPPQSAAPAPSGAGEESTDMAGQKDGADILSRSQAGDDTLTAEEQAAVDAAMLNDEKGYEEFLYHNRTMYRVLESPSHTFSNENDAVAFVAAMRVTRSLNESA